MMNYFQLLKNCYSTKQYFRLSKIVLPYLKQCD